MEPNHLVPRIKDDYWQTSFVVSFLRRASLNEFHFTSLGEEVAMDVVQVIYETSSDASRQCFSSQAVRLFRLAILV